MSQNDTVWYVSNVMTRFQSGKLDLDGARALIAKAPPSELQYWLAWQPGWPAWLPVKDVATLLPAADLPPPLPPMPMPPPVPQAAPARPQALEAKVAPAAVVATSAPVAAPVKEAPVVAQAPQPQPQQPKPQPKPQPKAENFVDRRKHKRYDIRFRVIIRNDGLTFRTFTKDISLGGVSLENPIPEAIFGQSCQIFIASLDLRENIRFNLGPTGRNDLRFFSFSNIDPKFREKLDEWLQKASAAAAAETAAPITGAEKKAG